MAGSPNTHDAEQLAARSATALRELEERARKALSISREQVTRLEAEITGQLEAIAATIVSEQAAGSRNAEDVETVRSALSRVTADFEAAQAAWTAERSELETARLERAQQAARLEGEQRKARDEWARQLTDFENKLRDQQAAWDQQRIELNETRAQLESQRDALQQKFELALDDVQRYRARVVELEQDLSRRPEAAQSDSAELVALRAERDALAERIEQLENKPTPPVDASAERQLSDLQRRFELAVEDVRELKTRNARLESQLAAAAASPGVAASAARGADSMDWESQKRRLLASLEDEGDPQDDPAREDERLRIASTIEITDAIVAQKDREIAELQAQIEQGLSGASCSIAEERARQVNEIVDADAVIAEHRQRIAQMERDMEAALRAAELELSLERAKLARERVEIDEARAELQVIRQELGPSATLPPGAPRRRWLSKLGLGGEDA